MSRPIKFRIWEKSIKKYLDFVAFAMDSNGELTAIASFGSLEPNLGKDDYILEQYTGLKDKNGKEIYEGDVVKCWDDENGEVYFCDISLQYRVKFTDGDDEDLASCEAEVIGNIHENEDLPGGGE